MDWVQWLALAGGLTAVAAFVQERRDRIRADAADVYVVVTEYRCASPEDEERSFTRFQVFNRAARPIFRVGVAAWDWGRRRITWRLRRHENWMTGRRIVGRVFSTIAPSTETSEAKLPGLLPDGDPGESPPIMLVFRDGHGRRWVRWPDGRLMKAYPSLLYFEELRWRRLARQRRPQVGS